MKMVSAGQNEERRHVENSEDAEKRTFCSSHPQIHMSSKTWTGPKKKSAIEGARTCNLSNGQNNIEYPTTTNQGTIQRAGSNVLGVDFSFHIYLSLSFLQDSLCARSRQ